MKTILIIFSSIILAGIIISPFFWLRFMKKKSVGKYLVASSLATLIIFGWYIFFGYNLISDWTAKTNADLYYFFYDVIDFVIYMIIFLIIISPFIFTKILKKNINIRNFFISLILSCVIFVSIFLFWVYVLLPQAFSQLHNYF